MPYLWMEPESVLEYRGVSVYHVYRNDSIDAGRREYLYTTDITEYQDPFDIRDLSCYAQNIKHEDILKQAIEMDMLAAPLDD